MFTSLCNVTLATWTKKMLLVYHIDGGIIKSHLMNLYSIGRQNFLFFFMFENVKANQPSVEINRSASRAHLTHI